MTAVLAQHNAQPLTLSAGKECNAMSDYLLSRRSVSVKNICAPGPSDEQIDLILQAASRVPDHGKMFPWHFLVFKGDARKEAGTLIADAYVAEHPDTTEAKIELERERFLRAPLVIAVISRIREGKHPQWEQLLSSGASCQNLCLAANALGFGTTWLTEWYSYSDTFKANLGLDEYDNIAGLIYIGTPAAQPEERDRPNLDEIVTHWSPGASLKNGKNYGYPGKGIPKTGITLPAPTQKSA